MMAPIGMWALLSALFGAHGVQGAASPNVLVATPSFIGSGIRFLYQNDLDWTKAISSSRQAGYLLLTTPSTADEAAAKCQSLGEALISSSASINAGLQDQLNYLIYDGSYPSAQSFWVADRAALTASSGRGGTASIKVVKPNIGSKFPALCTQSAPWNTANSTDTSARWLVTMQSNDVQYTGYRDAKSFRFLALPYANPTQRFTYSTVYDARTAGSGPISALDGSRDKQCPQNSDGFPTYTEQCQVLSIYTPYLPSTSETSNSRNLKPVLLWIHGGGYTSGSGLDYTFDGGNMASRSDVVVVNINYRLGSLGYLTYNEQVRGNYGLGDVVTSLKWVQKYIKEFGGDPERVTVAGQSAGAQHVENLLASPAAAGLFNRAIVFSGRGHDDSFTYPTIEQARQGRGGEVVRNLGCDTASDVLACLRSKSVGELVAQPFAIITQDGTYIRSPRLDMRSPDRAQGHVNRVPVIWGTMRDELASLGIVPPASETNVVNAMNTAGIASNYSDIVVREANTFPVKEYGVQNLTVSVNTDIKFRCGIQGMAYASVVNNVFPSVWSYLYDQRSYQIPNYDPNKVCMAGAGKLDASSYYMCHSGDLMTVFHTTGSAFRLPYRDENDLAWMASILDQFSAFVRTGNPAPSAAYLSARGEAYASSLARTTGEGRAWNKLTDGNFQSLSFGPVQQRMESLGQRNDQCSALGKALEYIARL
ncbi:related to Para-nitrobenzyl esterase [Melanopsichium pennsylvanicum]|uniref:Related to Para-nitrobenzyl esterase n=2 Tax=Melanopsichium pennsylvanicum TaxID=63383 RepID=A0AAJ5C2E2_9BASI|nr:related to Para-nitrobenzyl esterase [Melanopsichium pennsylvanicum 4]SNX81463.1 related to Para-nitrobenzyl esterase [Melanopsichium pennsylvanicum]